MKIVNSTLAYNISTNGVTGIVNGTGSSSVIVNSILWNDKNQNELDGSGFTVSYSCITKGYTGTGIITSYPQFTNPMLPEGLDGCYGTIDDGFTLNKNSNCIRAGCVIDYPEQDFLLFQRTSSEPADIGAYCYQINILETLGKIDTDLNFQPTTTFDVINGLDCEWAIVLCLSEKYYHVIQAELPKNKYTDKKNSIVVQVTGLSSNGSSVGATINVVLYRMNGSQVFRSVFFENGTRTGKGIIFSKDPTISVGEHQLAYVIEAEDRGKIKISLNKGQF